MISVKVIAMGLYMDLRSLTIFKTVARLGSVSAAARELNYVQSNVTMHIKQLEEKFQTTLFYRHQRGMTLNTEGRKMLEYVDAILRDVAELKHLFLEDDTPSGTLRLGTVEIVSKLPQILATYYAAYPNVDVSLQADVTEALVQKVMDHELDGAFVSGPIKHAMLEKQLIAKEQLVLVTATPTFDIASFAKTPILVSNEGCGYRAKLSLWLKEQGIQPKRIMEFNIIETILQSVALGLGVTVVPIETVQNMVIQQQVYCHPLPSQYASNTTVFIYRKDAFITKTMKSFLQHLQQLTP